MTKKKVKFGGLPMENMPKESHETPKPPSRPARQIVKEVLTTVENRKYYTGLKDVCKRIKALKTISEWIVEKRSDRVILRKMKDCFQLPEFELIIEWNIHMPVTSKQEQSRGGCQSQHTSRHLWQVQHLKDSS